MYIFEPEISHPAEVNVTVRIGPGAQASKEIKTVRTSVYRRIYTTGNLEEQNIIGFSGIMI